MKKRGRKGRIRRRRKWQFGDVQWIRREELVKVGGEGALGEGWELWEREVVGGIKRSPLPISCVKRYSSTVTVSNSSSMTTSSKRIFLPTVQVSRSSRQEVYVS